MGEGIGLGEYPFLSGRHLRLHTVVTAQDFCRGSGSTQDLQGEDRSHASSVCALRRKKAPIARSSRRRFCAGLAAAAFPAQTDMVHLYCTLQSVAVFPFAHGGYQSVVDAPSGRVTDSELAHQRHGREPHLGLTEQIDGETPRGPSRLRRLHHRTGGQRGLVAAGLALQTFREVILNDSVRPATGARAAKASCQAPAPPRPSFRCRTRRSTRASTFLPVNEPVSGPCCRVPLLM
jgi:hypothetical protein